MSLALKYMPLPRARWYLFANQSEAVIFTGDAVGPHFFVARLKNNRARRRERELGDDRPGRVVSGSSRHSLGREKVHHQHHIETFVARIAARLGRGLNEGRYDDLVVAAEPHFLGLLRKSLPEKVSEKVAEEIHKEFPPMSAVEARQRIKDWKNIRSFEESSRI